MKFEPCLFLIPRIFDFIIERMQGWKFFYKGETFFIHKHADRWWIVDPWTGSSFCDGTNRKKVLLKFKKMVNGVSWNKEHARVLIDEDRILRENGVKLPVNKWVYEKGFEL